MMLSFWNGNMINFYDRVNGVDVKRDIINPISSEKFQGDKYLIGTVLAIVLFIVLTPFFLWYFV